MSPLGWAWMVIFVIFGYVLFFVFFYYVWFCFLMFSDVEFSVGKILWQW